MPKLLRIGNASGFWGDRIGAAARLLAQQPNLNYITMDYLAEVSMSILAKQRDKNPSLGYATDFLEELRSLIPFWEKGAHCKVIVNAGGLNPLGCAQAAADILRGSKCSSMKIGVVSGDDVLTMLEADGDFPNLDTGESIQGVRESLVSANAYLGAKPIFEALNKGADIVITGRVADPSLVVACCVAHYNWGWDEYDRLAGATIAGHLIECGAQVTGGISTNWLEVPDPANIGFPVVEMSADGSFVITKPEDTGGIVSEETVKEQLLYELGDPDNYLSPDVNVSFLSLQLQEEGRNRVKVSGAKGSPPPSTYKVSATYRNGYMAEGILTLFGHHVRKKASRCGEIVLQRVRNAGFELNKTQIECIGSGDVVPETIPATPDWDLRECVLRICVADPRKEAVECFSKELVPLVTSGAQGTTGYFGGRPRVRQVFGYWPCLLDSHRVQPKVEIIEATLS
ncbi:MAG: hypothetical protein K940chlam7_01386 [Chlamydiae bacterium]|nr:hypothetical protein [Chlamydiota bacterium]